MRGQILIALSAVAALAMLGFSVPGVVPGVVPACAATHYVAKDGTGAFSVIQDAIDAAAPGDTIRVGAGRYEDFVPSTVPFSGPALIVDFTTSNLTMVGAGRDSVLIGPAEFTPTISGSQTVGMRVPDGSHGVEVASVTVENTKFGINVNEAARFHEIAVRHSSPMIGIANAQDVIIEDSIFSWSAADGSVTAVSSFVGMSVQNTIVRNCQFLGEFGSGVLLDNGGGSLVEGCYFEGVSIGVTLYQSMTAPVEIVDCTFVDNRNAGIAVLDGSDAVVTGCVIGDAVYRGLYVGRGGSTARVERSSIRGGEFGAIVTEGNVEVVVRDSDIFNDAGPRVLHHVPDNGTLQADLRHNYWGSADSTEIASWIDDGADDPPGGCEFWYCPRDTVDFWPVLDRSVPTSGKSVGGLKSRFRKGG